MLKSRKPLAAFRTLAPAPHGRIVVNIARIFDLSIVTPAKRTFHTVIFPSFSGHLSPDKVLKNIWLLL